MKILFVCRANVVRSQMAAALYNSLTHTQDADSAGVIVSEPGQTMGERAPAHPSAGFVIDVMEEKGIDLRGSKRTLLTKEMANNYDLIINMAASQYTPHWLTQLPGYKYWAITDPMGRGRSLTAEARDKIEQKVKELIRA